MRVFLSHFCAPKEGNSEAEYEDAFWPRRESDEAIEADRFRFAVADGASEGMLSRYWAQILARVYGKYGATLEDQDRFLNRAHREWRLAKTSYLRGRERANRPLQWYEEPGFAQGAFATILGLTLDRASGGQNAATWQAFAVGDTCLFQVRDEILLCHFPVEDSHCFNDRPVLVAAESDHNQRFSEVLQIIAGTCRVDDSLYLMTDALATWFLRAHEASDAPWQVLRDLETATQFRDWLSGLRDRGEIKNDDVTLVRVDIT